MDSLSVMDLKCKWGGTHFKNRCWVRHNSLYIPQKEICMHLKLSYTHLFLENFFLPFDFSFGLLNKSQANFRLSYLWNVSDSKAMKRLRQRTADRASQSPTKIFAMIGSTFNMFYERKNSTHQIEIILYNQSSVSFPHYFSHCFLYPIPYFSLIFSLPCHSL